MNNLINFRIPAAEVLAVRSDTNRNIKGFSDASAGFEVPSELLLSSSQESSSSSHPNIQPTIPSRMSKRKAPNLVPKSSKRRYKPGTVALRQIRRLQRSTDSLIPKASFKRLVKQVLAEKWPTLRIKAKAVEVLQEATEAYVCHLFEDSNLCAIHAKRVTVMTKDVDLSRRLNKKKY